MISDSAPSITNRIRERMYSLTMSVPVLVKISGLVLVPVIVLGFALNYWVSAGLQDWLSYLLADVRVEAAMRAGRRSVLFVTVLAAASSLLIGYLLTHILTRPLLELRRMALRVAAGDTSARINVRSNDEVGELATAVNTMTDHLVSSQDALARSNRRLLAINRVIAAANRPADIHDVLFDVLGIVVEVMRLETGWLYLRDPDRNQFHLATWVNVPAHMQQDLLEQSPIGFCDCQHRFMQGELELGHSTLHCQRILHSQSAQLSHHLPHHLPNHLSVPIATRDQYFGIMNLLVDDEQAISADDRDLLQAIGAQVSEIVANAWLRIKLNEKEIARQMLLEYLVRAQEEERTRLARELHDGAGQMLTGLLVRLKTLERKVDTSWAQAELSITQQLVAETLEQVRDLSYNLRPAALEEFGLPLTLETLVYDMCADADIDAECTTTLGELALSAEVEVTLYRIAQEGMTNIIRHADASLVLLNLAPAPGGVMLRLEDDGCGFSPFTSHAQPGGNHMGLISMQERAEIIGGTLTVHSAPGQGTSLVVFVPVAGATHE